MSPSLKAKVALEAMKGIRSINEIASEYEVHPNQVSQWKKQFQENAETLFSKTDKKLKEEKSSDEMNEKLYAKIGKLEMELEFLKKKQRAGSITQRKNMIEKDHPSISILRQSKLLSVSRSGVYYTPKPTITPDQKVVLDKIDELYTQYPFYGSRRMSAELKACGLNVGRKAIRSYFKILRVSAIYPEIKTTTPNKAHKKYPYLLRDVVVTHKNQVWSTDITYIRVGGSFMYLCAIIDWHTRYVLAWGISNTHDSEFVTEVLRDAIRKHGTPEIFNTDQGSEFTSELFTGTLSKHNILISMDGRKRALDNIFVERLWRSVKYEYVFIKYPMNGIELYQGLAEYFEFYNKKRLHQSLKYKTPAQMYQAA
ncbi:MAG: IS3 family transposase [Phocaeicola sp.]